MATPITRALLNLSNTCTEISLCQEKGWSWQRFSWVTDTIKFSAKQLKQGVPLDKIIDWKDKRKTTGNNFDTVETFFHAMHIAATEYGMDDILYRDFQHLRFDEIREIETKWTAGAPDVLLRAQYRLIDSEIIPDLSGRANRVKERLVTALRAVGSRSQGN